MTEAGALPRWVSAGLQPALGQRMEASLTREGIARVGQEEVDEASFEQASALFTRLPGGCDAIVGFGGGRALDATGFWRGIASDPFSRREWLEAVRLTPSLKQDFYTVLSSRDCAPEVETLLRTDPRLAGCFIA